MRYFLATLALAVGLTAAMIVWGCGGQTGASSLAGNYSEAPSKNPRMLRLNKDGSYAWELVYTPLSRKETGRWWPLRDHVVVLLPESAREDAWFACVQEKGSVGIVYSNDLHKVIDLQPGPQYPVPVETVPKVK